MLITAHVPATSANLGPGFDCLGLALEMRSEVAIELDRPFSIEIEGEGVSHLPRDARNLVYRTIRGFFHRVGKQLPPFQLRLRNRIPLTGGLGSSSAALVGALLVANVAAGRPCQIGELVEIATELEGHPDNVAPALLGGLVVAIIGVEKRIITLRVPVPPELTTVVFVPNFSMPTKRAREILPEMVPRRDAIFNLSRVAVWMSALQTQRYDLLRIATEDRLHQPYRAQIFPSMPAIIEAAIASGAHGAFLSGAGSAMLALATEKQSFIGEAMLEAASRNGIKGRWFTAEIAQNGAYVVDLP